MSSRSFHPILRASTRSTPLLWVAPLCLSLLLGCAQPLRFSDRQPLVLEEEVTTAALARRPLDPKPSTAPTETAAAAPALAATSATAAAAAPPQPSTTPATTTAEKKPAAASAPAPTPTAATEAFSSVIAELESLGTLDAAARDRLLSDLQRTDPKIWTALIQYFKASVAMQRGEATPRAAGETVAGQVATQTIGSQPTTGRTPPEPELAPRAEPSSQSRAPAPNQQTAWEAALEEPDTHVSTKPQTPAPRDTPGTSTSPRPRDPRLAARLRPRPAAAATTKSKRGTGPPVSPPDTEPNERVTSAGRPPSGAVTTAHFETPVQADDPLVEQQSWRAALAAAIASLEHDLAERPAAGEHDQRPVLLRLLHVMLGQKERALQPLEGMGAARQEFWTNELLGLEAWMSPAEGEEDGRRAALAARHLAHAASLLGETGLLVVRNLAFCTEIKDFGVYQRFDQYDFAPGQKILLYAEVENFKSESTAQGFRTALASRCQVLDPQGGQIDDIDFPLTEEHCQSRRRDFFVPYVLTLPGQMADGRHTLRLTIEDTLGQKVGQSTIVFSVKNRNRSRDDLRDTRTTDARTPAEMATEILKRAPNLSR